MEENLKKENLKKLIEGNKRFVEGKALNPNRSQETRDSLYNSQHPFAVVISCSDSRAPVEILFDVGIGDIFTIRTAGHILTEAGLASLEYAIDHLNVNLVVVMGHENCGAVKASLEEHGESNHEHSHIDTLIEKIKPAVEKAKKEAKSDNELFDLSIKYNVLNTIDSIISSSNIAKKAVESNKIKFIPAKYHIKSGVVEILE